MWSCRSALALAFLLAVSLVAPTSAHARYSEGSGVAVSLEYALGARQLSLGERVFTASGTLAGTGETASLRVDGRSAGLNRPIATDFTAQLLWTVIPHLVVGGVLGVSVGDGDVAPRPLPVAVASTFAAVRVGPAVGTVFTHRWLELRATVALGFFSASLPVLGFERVPCKGGLCYPGADTTDLFIEPRLSLAARPCLDPHRFCASIAFGAYVGGDLMPWSSFAAGGFIAIRPHRWWSLHDLHPGER
jgi:hypothetical protein